MRFNRWSRAGEFFLPRLDAGGGAIVIGRMSAPRIAILGKTRSILTWLDDTLDGFARAGAVALPIAFQTETPAERLSERRGEGKELFNPAVVQRTAQELAAAKPDLVIVLNKAGVPGPAMEAWRKVLPAQVPIIGWLCDCISKMPVGQLPVFDGVYYFDSHCTAPLRQAYGEAPRIDYLPLAVNPARYEFCDVAQVKKPWLVFAGKCSATRHARFAEFRAAGIQLDLFGPGSRQWLRPWRGRRLSSAALADLYRSYLAVLNLPQPGNTERGLNLRAFEVPAAGGIGTYPDVPDLPRCFEPGVEMLVYRDADDLCGQLTALRADPQRARAMVRAGHDRVLAEHTFEHRARRILADWL